MVYFLFFSIFLFFLQNTLDLFAQARGVDIVGWGIVIKVEAVEGWVYRV